MHMLITSLNTDPRMKVLPAVVLCLGLSKADVTASKLLPFQAKVADESGNVISDGAKVVPV